MIFNSSLCHIFKKLIKKFIIPEPNRISSAQNFEGLKLLTRRRLGLSHLADIISRHNFQDCIKLMIRRSKQQAVLLHCLNYRCRSETLFKKNNLIDSNILQQNNLSITKDLIFGSEKLEDDKNDALLTSTIEVIESTGTFKCP